jgi:hypothetical protein
LTINETTWAIVGYSDIQGRMRGKKVSKGGQHTLAVDALSRYIYAYTPWHSRFTHTAPFTQEGPAEVKRLLDQLIPLVRGRDKDEGDLWRQIFHQPMVFEMDNHFPMLQTLLVSMALDRSVQFVVIGCQRSVRRRAFTM